MFGSDEQLFDRLIRIKFFQKSMACFSEINLNRFSEMHFSDMMTMFSLSLTELKTEFNKYLDVDRMLENMKNDNVIGMIVKDRVYPSTELFKNSFSEMVATMIAKTLINEVEYDAFVSVLHNLNFHVNYASINENNSLVDSIFAKYKEIFEKKNKQNNKCGLKTLNKKCIDRFE